MPGDDRILRDHLLELLRGGSAHIDFKSAMKDFPPELYGKKPEGTPYSAWQLLEHLRIALHDILDFCVNPKYTAMEWPEDFWPKDAAPPSNEAWRSSVRAIEADIAEFERLTGDPHSNLYAKIPWGDGQTLLREILLAADHNSYHLGQLVMLKKQLEA
ncbi:DinB family protein [Alloacidobacterium dinghuense]|uniref:DinB family protein n=1 Tax=Alloacidobacterium dinghuense TaxID=2763107 RepID=A0A7G8BPV7_9BACT|nr:DinB family protein [Alloacidobacterium dinghuense]QNI34577.1 DinB family protein [Alloacidobacterium dinghuense]